MRARRWTILVSVVSSIVVPVLINLATSGLPNGWHRTQWMQAAAMTAVALVLVVLVQAPSGRSEPRTEDDVIRELATAVRIQWSEELKVRELEDPVPIPVSWTAADAALTVPLEQLILLARRWWPDRPPPTLDRLSGSGQLVDVLAGVPTGRLVVLGGPGTGKTVLLVNLVLRLLDRRDDATGGATRPVPVLFSLASWDPSRAGLWEWLEARLIADHTALREPAHGTQTWARKLIDEGVLFPVLDGFDELPGHLRAEAFYGINNALRDRAGFVLSSRTTDFADAVQAPGRTPVHLAGFAAVELAPLDIQDAHRYLAEDARGTEDRWTQVFEARTDVVDAILRTPLRISLARRIYNPRPGESVTDLADPRELCDRTLNPDVAAADRRLFAAFVAACYRRFPGQRKPPFCTAFSAEKWLRYLAGWMSRDDPSTPVIDLAWWELRDAVGAPAIGLVAGLLPALAVGLVAALTGTLGCGLGLGILVALAVVFAPLRLQGGRVRVAAPSFRVSDEAGTPVTRGPSIVRGMAGGFVGGFLGGLIGGLVGHLVRGTSAAAGIMGGLGAGIGAGAIGGPRRGLAGGFAGGVAVGLCAGSGTGVPAGLIDGGGAWLAAAATVGLTGIRRPARELQALHYSKVGMIVGGTVAIAVGAQVWLRLGWQTGVLAGLAVGILGGLAAGLEGVTVEPTKVAEPATVLTRDRGTFMTVGVLGGLSFGLGAGFGVRPSVGAAAGLTVGLVAACIQASFGPYLIAASWLALRRKLPWRLMRFLDDAHRLGVLRQSGAVYQFRHIELQKHLAGRRISSAPVPRRRNSTPSTAGSPRPPTTRASQPKPGN